uniref:Uncharacterized protein n=1 Tax=Arundo donax TaxID=35708 RepID=A0A0A9G425_ARUDO
MNNSTNNQIQVGSGTRFLRQNRLSIDAL